MDGILSLLSSIGGNKVPTLGTPALGSIGSPQREVALPEETGMKNGAWTQTRGHKKNDDN